MNWVEFGIYGVCLVGSNLITYDFSIKIGIQKCLEHLEREGVITLEHDNDE